tara:strand:- start:604 stop:801 length:198 start_codon:yes stop_codon:yes gene_type:complete
MNYIYNKTHMKNTNEMDFTALSLFNHMTDADFLAIHDAGQLKSLCLALSLDLQSIKSKNKTTFTA